MPNIHFVFGSDYRSGKLARQVENFIELILKTRQLKASICPEFLPLPGCRGGKLLAPNPESVTEDGAVFFKEVGETAPVILLKEDVWLLSFVCIPFKKLSHWAPSDHYGKLGIAFSDRFSRRAQIRHVSYYELHGLERDPLVVKHNQARFNNDGATTQRLHDQLVAYRKPARLWPEFQNLYAIFRLTRTDDGVDVSKITYDRYPTGYDFRQERETRILLTEESQYLNFKETDVLKIIVPDTEIKKTVEKFLVANWQVQPEVIVYPTVRENIQ